jgi:malto-oligosyltrehalose trehalohydrolase
MIEANPFGPLITPENVIFRLWAPEAQRVELLHRETHEMRRTDDGWFKLTIPGAQPGDRYKFRIDGKIEVPDPASCFQPDDVHGPSEVIDHSAYEWQTRGWAGRPWHECVFLELHVGTFTKDGTFRDVTDKLDEVAAAGITAIELMPVADFPGRWNWGYDGVLLYAPDSTYGRPEDLKALVDAAHTRGLMVFLDVVYNHFGPEGNYLGHYAPQFFTPAQTPWGDAIDYERPEVRRFAVENALHWLSEFRFDGLRLDAVHAIAGPGRAMLLREISEAVGTLAAQTARHIHLVLENDANQASLLDPITDPPRGKYRAQWNDDFHHAFHVLLTGETQGHYGDYRDAARHLVRTLAEGFAYQGEPSPHRREVRGEPTTSLPATAFVNFLQNHDQIGNRALGERLDVLAKPEALEAALAIMLLTPGPPLLFMGEQWGAREPFPFFCDFKGELAVAVRKGRRKEFRDAYVQHGDEVPDPLSEQTVRSATLDWAAAEQPEHRTRLELVTRLLAARREFVMPRLPQLRPGHGRVEFVDGVLTATWFLRSGETLSIVANLSGRSLPRPQPFSQGETVWGDIAWAELPPWSVHAAIGGS